MFMGARSWYPYLADAFVGPGRYAMVSVGTYEYVPASAPELAPDQAFLLDEVRRQAATNASFPLFGRIDASPDAPAAAGGHSVGGAATFVACDKDAKCLHGHSVNFTGMGTLSACAGYNRSHGARSGSRCRACTCRHSN